MEDGFKIDVDKLVLEAPFGVPYAYGNVRQNNHKPKFDNRMRERSKQLR